MLEQPRQQQDELIAQFQKRMAALEQENTILKQRLADSSAVEQRYRLLESRDRIFEATISASNALFTIENFDEAVNTALQIIGEKLDSDRVAVIENLDSPPEQLPRWKVVYEWHSPHTVPQISHPNVAQGSYEDIQEWYALFSQGESVSCLLEEMPEPFRSGQAELSVKAFHIVPIFVEGECWGVVGFDDCREAKRRSLDELAVLKNAAACIGSAIESDRSRQALLQAEQERATQLEHINAELRQALDRLAESEERFRTLFELSSEGFNYVEFDPPYSVTLPIEEQCELYRKNLRVVKVNPAFAAMYGVDNPDDLIGLQIADVHVEDSEKNAAFFRAIVENGYRVRNIETEEIDRYGQLRYFLNSGVITIKDNYVVNGWGTQVDITELRETQQALLHAEQERAAELAGINMELQRTLDRLTESEERYRTLFELSSEGIYRFEVNPPVSTSLPLDEQCKLAEQHWRVVEANQAFASQYGLSSIQEAINFTFETSSQAGTENLREVNQALIANGYRIRNIQTEEMDVRGNRKYFLQSIVCDIEDGFIKGGWGMQADVTELRQAQQKLLQAAKEQAAKLESVNAVLHESVKQLSNEADTEVFLGYVLAEMARQVDAALVHLFRYDASNHTLTLHLTYLKGKLRQGTSNEECELFAAPFPTDITPAFELMCQHRQFMTPDATPIPVEEFAWPGALEWLARIQASDAAHMVLFVGDTPVGTMGLAFTDGKTLHKKDQPLVMALAQQCAIALRLSDLAERSRQAAIAREQQKAALERAAELESLNAALRRETRERCQAEEVIRSQNCALKHSLERLLQEPNIRGFLGALLDTLITQLQGHAANVWLLQDDRTTLTLWTAFAMERLHTNPEETLLPYEPIPVDLVAQTILSVKAGWQQTIYYSGDDPRLPLPLQEFHKCDRICSVLTTPLRLGHHLLGWLAFATQENLQQMPSDKVAFLEAIAHQATLAIHLHHLAEEAKQAAIAREQEKAAQERAAELAKANHALRESLGSLASNPELDTFLGYMLLEMATQLDAVKNYLFLYDRSTHTLSLHTFVRHGKVFSKQANDFELFAQPIPADMTPAWRLMIQEKSPLNLALEQDNPSFWSGTYEWHCAQGHQGVLCVPLILGEEPLGFLGLAFTQKAMLSPQEIELAQALAHQVTLAIQLTRLAEERRQTAILEERNRMAREIHDTLAQAFAGIGMQLQAANRFRTTNPDKAQIHCDRAYALAQTGLTEARRSVWALSQEGLEYSDLSASVTRIAEQLTAGTSLQVQIEVQGTPYSIEPEVGLNLLRIAQEAIANALRHAQAQTSQIQITYEPSYVRLGVRDDGRGFDPQLPVKGFGLASMQQRADHIGAQLLVSSQLGAGTEIVVILPMGE